MKKFIDDFPNIEFFFVMGTDLIESMENWENSLKLKEEINFLIFLRTGVTLNPSLLPKNFILIETTFLGASSTVVRKRIKQYFKRKKMENKNEDKFEESESGNRYFSKEEWRVKRSDKSLDEFHDKYLGVYGIISLGVIEYIKAQKLYQS